MTDKSNLLRNTLLINAGSSLLFGGAALAFADPLAQWTGIASWILYVLGAGLVLFAADVAWTATRDPINPLFAKAIIAADVAWVAGSGLSLLLFSDRLTTLGQWSIELIALAVAAFAVLQTVGLRRLGDHHPRTA